MKKIQAVIGANFGDEGKGLITDYLAAGLENGIIIRFNGGAQAGHTVTTPDGLRHVFGHVGAGAFVGLPTYLSSYFVLNPMLFKKEILQLKKLGIVPCVLVDKQCMVTTPYDMLLNQIVELFRGSSKHGSCGVGFNETITRNLAEDAYQIKATDLKNQFLVKQKLQAIQKDYIPRRLKQLEVSSVPDSYQRLLEEETIIESFLNDIQYMLAKIEIVDCSVIHTYDSLLFEGAQGLLLDQSHPFFPHVTRSNTGIKNVVELLNQTGLEDETVEIVYITRAYLTRHGVGPFPTELPEKPYPRIEDLTNVPNPYQDALRYGLLDLNTLSENISMDLKNIKNIKCKTKIAITCLDQLDDQVDFVHDSFEKKASIDEFIQVAMKSLNISEGYVSYGPSRNNVDCIRKKSL